MMGGLKERQADLKCNTEETGRKRPCQRSKGCRQGLAIKHQASTSFARISPEQFQSSQGRQTSRDEMVDVCLEVRALQAQHSRDQDLLLCSCRHRAESEVKT